MINILCVGDIFGENGVYCALKWIKKIKEMRRIDFIIANTENSYFGGRGPSHFAIKKLSEEGVNVFTGGNHSFDVPNNFFLYDEYPSLIRPLNFPDETTPGKGFYICEKMNICVVNIQLRVFMKELLNCPFKEIDQFLTKIKNMITIVDVHGEATAEKLTFGYYLDGRVSGVFGTHTHVQTADARILPQGTGYITDIGMVGPLHSSIGLKIEPAIRRAKTQIYCKMEEATEGDYVFSAIIFSVNPETKKCEKIERVYWV